MIKNSADVETKFLAIQMCRRLREWRRFILIRHESAALVQEEIEKNEGSSRTRRSD